MHVDILIKLFNYTINETFRYISNDLATRSEKYR